jgi:hypothetical protein
VELKVSAAHLYMSNGQQFAAKTTLKGQQALDNVINIATM